MTISSFSPDPVWEAIWDAVNLGLILIDHEGRVQQWNKWVAKRSGIPAEFAIGHSLESLFPGGLSSPFKTALNNALWHKLPIVLSNALHHSPLPLYPLPVTQLSQARIQQSISLTPMITGNGEHVCLIQITDASTAIQREQLLKRQSHQFSLDARTDSLTGAYNRRFFDERYKAEFARAQRHGTPLSLLMMDIDYFKDYNDAYGHPAGDKILISVVKAIQSQLNRATDVVTRYGGEEFAVIMPDCEMEGSQMLAEKLRAAVANLNIPHCKSKVADHVTLSIGSTTLTGNIKCTINCLLETVDSALYQAKHAGRNCVKYLATPECQKPCPEHEIATPSVS